MDLEQLISNLLSNDPEIQRDANEQYIALFSSNPLETCSQMMEIFSSKVGDAGLTFIVLLSRIIKTNLSQFLESDFRSNIIEFSLTALANNQITLKVQMIAADLLIQMCTNNIPDGIIEHLTTIAMSSQISPVTAAASVLISLFNIHSFPAEARLPIVDQFFQQYNQDLQYFLMICSFIFDVYVKQRAIDTSAYLQYVLEGFAAFSQSAPNIYPFLQLLNNFLAGSRLNADFFGDSIPALIEIVIGIFENAERPRCARIICLEIIDSLISGDTDPEIISTIIEKMLEVIVQWDPESEDLTDPQYEDPSPRSDTESKLSDIVNKVQSVEGLVELLGSKVQEFAQSDDVRVVRAALVIIKQTCQFFSVPQMYEFIDLFRTVLTETDNAILHKETYECLSNCCQMRDFTVNYNSELADIFEWAIENTPTVVMFSAFYQYISMSDPVYLDSKGVLEALVTVCQSAAEAEESELVHRILECLSSTVSKVNDMIGEETRQEVVEFVISIIESFPVYAIYTYLLLVKGHEYDESQYQEVTALLIQINPQDLSAEEYKCFSSSITMVFFNSSAAGIADQLLQLVYQIAQTPLNIQEIALSELTENDDSDSKTFHIPSRNTVVICADEELKRLNMALTMLQAALMQDEFQFVPEQIQTVLENCLQYQYMEDVMEPLVEMMQTLVPVSLINQSFQVMIQPLSSINPLIVADVVMEGLIMCFTIATDADVKAGNADAFIPVVHNFILTTGTRVMNNLDDEYNDEINYQRGKMMLDLMTSYPDAFVPFFNEHAADQFPLSVDDVHPDNLAGSILPHFVVAADPNEYTEVIRQCIDIDNPYVRSASIRALYLSLSSREIAPELIVQVAIKVSEITKIIDCYPDDDEQDINTPVDFDKYVAYIMMKGFQTDSDLANDDEYLETFYQYLCPTIELNMEPALFFFDLFKAKDPDMRVVEAVRKLINAIDPIINNEERSSILSIEEAAGIKQRLFDECINTEQWNPLFSCC